MGAHYPAMALVEVVPAGRAPDAKVEIEATAVVPGCDARSASSATACRRRTQLPEFRFDLPELQYPERLNAAAELLKGGEPTRLQSSTIMAAGPTPSSTILSGRIARLLVEEEGLVPGNRVLLRGPNGYTMFAAWLGVLKAGGVVVATMPLLRPGEIATVIERAEISHAIVDSRFIGDFREAVDQTHFVKHIVKYDGDYGQGRTGDAHRVA